MSFCSTPKQIGDTRYVHGISCTWHGPISAADEKKHTVDTSSYGEAPQHFEARVPCCPSCGGDLNETATEELFWQMVRHRERQLMRDYGRYEDMLRWSAGRCFPDFDTLQNAWRQAMEGQS